MERALVGRCHKGKTIISLVNWAKGMRQMKERGGMDVHRLFLISSLLFSFGASPPSIADANRMRKPFPSDSKKKLGSALTMYTVSR